MPDRSWSTVFFPTPLIFRYHLPLKVDGNEKLGASGRIQKWSFSLALWRSKFFVIWTCSFPVNNLFLFPLATTKSIGDVRMKRQSGVKILLSVVTALILSRARVKLCTNPGHNTNLTNFTLVFYLSMAVCCSTEAPCPSWCGKRMVVFSWTRPTSSWIQLTAGPPCISR